MLPYASYLRVYEPLSALGPELRASLTDPATALPSSDATLADEQRTGLTRAVTSSTISIESAADCHVYVMMRGGRSYFCPVDMPLRSWLSMTSLIHSIGGAAASLIVPPESLALADEQFLHWRRDNPQAVPHIRQVTWGVPRTWFTLVVDDERTSYEAGRAVSVRYRAKLRDARQRAAAARHVLIDIDDTDLLDELSGLGTWLGAFHDDSWVEVDYAGVAELLGEQLAADHSAREIHEALDALRHGDLATASSVYRRFEDRWRPVRGYERAN